MIVFFVMSHSQTALVERLLGRLDEARDAVTLVHHDPRGSPPPSLPEGGRAALLPDPSAVRWASLDVVEVVLRAMRWAREEVPDFSWLVLLSGRDYPVMSPRAIEAELMESRADAYMRWEFTPPFARRHVSDWQRGTSHRYYWRLFPGSHRPVPVPRLRCYFDGVGVFAGSAWTTFGRRSVDRIFEQPERLDYLRNRFRGVHIPDEAFFQTLLMNSPLGLTIVNDDRRFYDFAPAEGYAHPHVLTLDWFDELLGSNAMFARKMDQDESAPLLDALDQAHEGSPP